MPRKDLTLSEKITLLDKIKSQAPNASHRTLEKLTGVPKSTISRVLKNEQKFRFEWALQENQQGISRKRKREGKEPEVEHALNQWFAKVTARDVTGVRITGPMLKMKAEDLAKKLGRPDFKATDGWLSRWKSRHEIKFKRAQSDAQRAERWKLSKLPELLKHFSADDIYNADETGLFYRAAPDGSLCYKHDALVGSKKAMDCVTVLCCCNMSGSDRRKLLVIGKHIMPRCFNGLRMDALPVLYEANENAWMTPEIFSKWLKEWDVQLQGQSRKILLFLDNCAVHPQIDSLKNIQLEFLPTDILQPMEMGITQSLKTFYRDRLVRWILDAIEENRLHSNSTAVEVSREINILQAVQYVADSWREIKESTIRNCFALSGWKNSEHWEVPNATNKANERNLQIVENYEDFLAVDSNLECYNENDDYDEIEEIVVKHELTEENQDSDDDDVDEEIKPVTHRDARKFIDQLRIYFMQTGNEGGPTSSLDACADFVNSQSVKNSQQGLLDVFCKPI